MVFGLRTTSERLAISWELNASMQDNRFTRRFWESNFQQDLRVESQIYSLWDLMKKRVKGKLFRRKISAHVRIIEGPLHGKQARILSNYQSNNLDQENADGKHDGGELFGQFARRFMLQ